MINSDKETLTFLCEDQFSFLIVFEKLKALFIDFPKTIFGVVYASCVICFISLRYFPNNIIAFIVVALLLFGVISLPSSFSEIRTIVEIFLIVIAGIAALLFVAIILLIFIPPEVSFEKERIKIGGKSIKSKEIIRIQITETPKSYHINLHYRDSDAKSDSQDTLYLVINESTKEKLSKMSAWCEQRSTQVEIASNRMDSLDTD